MSAPQWYPPPRETKMRWPGMAERYTDRNGNSATRYWVLPQIMVGGSILTREDWEHLQKDYGITGVLSVESQPSEEGLWVPERKHLPFEDDGKEIPRAIIMEAIGYARKHVARPENILYVHCALGGARSPSIAYGICRRVYDLGPSYVLSLIRCARPEYGIWRSEDITRYLNSVESALHSGEPEITS